MSESQTAVSVMSDEEVLNFTQSKRREFFTALTPKGLPENKEDRQAVMQLMEGLDRVAIGKLRIKADEKQSKAISDAAALMAGVLNRITDPTIFQTKEIGRIIEAPSLSDDLPALTMVDGEMAINPPQLDYDNFMKQFEDEPGSDSAPQN